MRSSGQPEQAKELIRKCNGCDAAKAIARRTMHKTQWSKLMESCDLIVGPLEYELPLKTQICLAKRYGTDSGKNKSWAHLKDCTSMATQAGVFKHQSPRFVDCMPDDDDAEGWIYWRTHYLQTCWSSGIFVMFEEVHHQHQQESILAYAKAMTDGSVKVHEDHSPEVDAILEGPRRVARMCAATLKPKPHYLGSTPEDVWFCFGQPGEKKSTAAQLKRVEEASGIASEFRSNKAWQQFLTEFCDHVGTEDTHGAEYTAQEDKVCSMVASIETSKPENETEEEAKQRISPLLAPGGDDAESVDSYIEQFVEDGTWWRENLRPGGSDDLDAGMAKLMRWKFIVQLGAGVSCTEADLKDFKKACRKCGCDDLLREVTAAIMKSTESSQNQGICSICALDMSEVKNMMSLLSALRTSEFMKKDTEAISAMKGVFDNMGKTVVTFVEDQKVTLEVIDDILQVPFVMAKDEDLAHRFLLSPSALQKEVEAFSVVVRATASIKAAASQLTIASRSDDKLGATVKAAVIAMHKTISTSKTVFARPPTLSDDSPLMAAARRVIAIGQQWCSPEAGKGFQGVLAKFTTETLQRDLSDIKDRAAELMKVAGGSPDPNKSWKENLKSNAAFAKISDAFTNTLAKSDAAGIERQLDTLKEDAQ